MTSFKLNTPARPETFSLITPGASPEAALLSEQLLNRNNKEFHCFFNNRKFHNHLIHHLLAAYSLGASKEKIQEIFDAHASYQRPLPPSIGTFTRENYKEHLGKAEAYTSFLNLFQSEIEKYGLIDTVRRWVWSGDMLARIVDGVYHALIHIGYGLEFDIPGIAAEGLAMTACTDRGFADLVPELPELQTSTLVPTQAQAYAENASSTARGYVTQIVDQLSNQISTRLGISEKVVSPSATERNVIEQDSVPIFLKENTLFPIFNEIRKDPVFDNLIKSTDIPRTKVLLDNKTAVARVKEYADKWVLTENTKDIQAKFKDLYTVIGIALGSSGLRKEHPDVLKLDFFLMHALTSAEFLHQYITKVAPSEAVSLLRAHLSATLVHFISAGRPDFNVDGLLAYKSPNQVETSNNNWFNVFDKSLSCEEPHVIKVVRACAVAQIIYGPHEDTHLNAVWLQVAQMSIDKDGVWDFSGVGFNDSWTTEKKN